MFEFPTYHYNQRKAAFHAFLSRHDKEIYLENKIHNMLLRQSLSVPPLAQLTYQKTDSLKKNLIQAFLKGTTQPILNGI